MPTCALLNVATNVPPELALAGQLVTVPPLWLGTWRHSAWATARSPGRARSSSCAPPGANASKPAAAPSLARASASALKKPNHSHALLALPGE